MRRTFQIQIFVFDRGKTSVLATIKFALCKTESLNIYLRPNYWAQHYVRVLTTPFITSASVKSLNSCQAQGKDLTGIIVFLIYQTLSLNLNNLEDSCLYWCLMLRGLGNTKTLQHGCCRLWSMQQCSAVHPALCCSHLNACLASDLVGNSHSRRINIIPKLKKIFLQV